MLYNRKNDQVVFKLYRIRGKKNLIFEKGLPLSSQDSDWKELRDWTSDMLPLVL
jgi:hypothetical protein